jgi:hypothetical protein
MVAVLGPWGDRGGMPTSYQQIQQLCADNERSYLVQTHPALAIHSVADSGKTFHDCYPSTTLSIESFRTNLRFNHHVSDREELNSTTIFLARDLADDGIVFFLTDTSEFANSKGTLSGCSNSLQLPRSVAPVRIHSLQELSIH